MEVPWRYLVYKRHATTFQEEYVYVSLRYETFEIDFPSVSMRYTRLYVILVLVSEGIRVWCRSALLIRVLILYCTRFHNINFIILIHIFIFFSCVVNS